MNAVVAAVLIMLVLSLCRIHVVVALIIGAISGGLVAGMSLEDTINAFNSGLGGGATVALSYATLGAFAVVEMRAINAAAQDIKTSWLPSVRWSSFVTA